MTTFSSTPGNGSQPGGGEASGFGHRVERIGTDAQQLIEDARGAVTDLSATLDLKGRVDRHPYGMMAAAVGVGYVLGGGLFTPTTARLIRLGVRLAALPFVKDELLAMAENAVRGFQAGSGAVAGASASASNVGPSNRTGV